MRTNLRTGLVALIAALSVALLLPGAGAAAAPVVDTATYLADVNAAANGLTTYGNVLNSTSSIKDLRRKVHRARVGLLKFDRHTYVLSRYRLRSRKLDRQRAALARTAPGVTLVLSDFLDAASADDLAEVTRLLPIVQARIAAFQKAVEG